MKIIRKEMIIGEPAPKPSCHASTVERLADGTFVSAWFAGESEGKNDVGIWVSRNDNDKWSTSEEVSREKGIPHWNPVLFSEDGKKLTLFYKVGYKIPDWQTFVMHSADGGKTWDEPRELVQGDTSGGRGPVKNKPILISNGNLLAPASTEQGKWRCFIDMYGKGKNWDKKIIPVGAELEDRVNVIQPTLWEQPEGHIHALMRSNMAYVCMSESKDYGETWSNLRITDIPNNNSGIDCVLTECGKVVLVCNPVAKHAGERYPLSVFVSGNNGERFERVTDLETEEGEFSYPAVISRGNRVYITYTWNRKNVVFCEMEI